MNAPQVIPVTLAASAAIAVGAGLTVYTDVIMTDNVDTFSVEYKAVCTGLPNVKIEMEECLVEPTANASYTRSVVPETISEIVAALVDSNYHLAAFFPVCARYVRFKITELSAVTADTVLTMNVAAQNRFRQ